MTTACDPSEVICTNAFCTSQPVSAFSLVSMFASSVGTVPDLAVIFIQTSAVRAVSILNCTLVLPSATSALSGLISFLEIVFCVPI